ncbi:hypothetical protein [Fusobacterium polymorphum]|uniref:hypothetical protein n=1 Tax=Fusobacterium nucleatum subsp. polymorphum TaxID=76857 RepID=UPI00300B6F57
MKKKEIELKKIEDEYMIKVKGGKYKPSFYRGDFQAIDSDDYVGFRIVRTI